MSSQHHHPLDAPTNNNNPAQDPTGATSSTDKDALVEDDDIEDEDTEIVNDWITPEMNYKESTGGYKSPPMVKMGTFDGDDISLYGTPRTNSIGNVGGVGGVGGDPKASFMRSQIESLFQPSDNKLAMKLFGSKKALMKERMRQRQSGLWIIHPCSNFR